MAARNKRRVCPECKSRKRHPQVIGTPGVVFPGARFFGYKHIKTDSGGKYLPCDPDDPDEIGNTDPQKFIEAAAQKTQEDDLDG